MPVRRSVGLQAEAGWRAPLCARSGRLRRPGRLRRGLRGHVPQNSPVLVPAKPRRSNRRERPPQSASGSKHLGEKLLKAQLRDLLLLLGRRHQLRIGAALLSVGFSVAGCQRRAGGLTRASRSKCHCSCGTGKGKSPRIRFTTAAVLNGGRGSAPGNARATRPGSPTQTGQWRR